MGAHYFRQIWTASAVLLTMVGQGMMLSYTTALLPALQKSDSEIKADLNTISWLASSAGLAGVPGLLMSSTFMEIFGRKIAHFLVLLPGVVGWMAIYFAKDVPTLMIGRILGGITAGATVALGAVVIGEYTDPKIRGVLLNLKTVSVSFGGMFVHVMVHFVTWRTIALVSIIPCVAAMLIICTWTESPAWLASKGEFEKSKKSFLWLRGESEASLKEINGCIKAQMDKLSIPKVKKPLSDEVVDFFKRFSKRDFVMPLFITIVGAVLLEASGRHIFPAYALQIVNELTGDVGHSLYYTLGIDILITSSAIFSSVLIKIMNRRTLLFYTGFFAVTVIMIACTYLTLVANGVISNNYPWIPLVIFFAFFISANLGCTPIPLALLGEVFPLAHRGVGSAVAGAWMSIAVMAGYQVTPYLLVNIKIYGAFFVFGATMGTMLLILYFILPETKDRTLQEIENYFKYGRYGDENDKEANIKMVKL